jgi:hypothetical protein
MNHELEEKIREAYRLVRKSRQDIRYMEKELDWLEKKRPRAESIIALKALEILGGVGETEKKEAADYARQALYPQQKSVETN